MSLNVHALEKIRPLRSEVDRPDRADVEQLLTSSFRAELELGRSWRG